MTWAWRLCWKEYREQRLFWLAIAAGSAVVVAGSAGVLTGPDAALRSALAWLVLVLAGTYAVVCSGLLLAGEREARTQPFLDTLPGGRRALWRVKAAFGLLLTLALTLLLFAVSSSLGLFPADYAGEPRAWLALMLLVAVETYGWGLCASAVCRNVLASAGLTVVLVAVAWGVVLFLSGVTPVGAPLWHLALAGAGVAASRRRYGAPDSQRVRYRPRDHATGPGSRRVLWWLCWRQGRWVIAGLAGGLVAAGVAVQEHRLFLLWPVASWLVGVVCGVSVCAGDQAGDGRRFLAGLRVPPARLWGWKVLFWLGVAVAAAAFLWLSAGLGYALLQLRTDGHDFFAGDQHSTLAHFAFYSGPSLLVFASLWFAYGFSVSLLAAQLCRKPVVAAVVGTAASVVLLAFWLPSIPWLQLSPWQVFAVPAALLLTSLALTKPWLADRLATPRPVILLTVTAAFVTLWTAGNLAWRALEVPDVGPPFDARAYAATLPEGERNAAAVLLREAYQEYETRRDKVLAEVYPEPLRPGDVPRAAAPEADSAYRTKLSGLVFRAWPADDKGLAAYLDRLFAGPWVEKVKKASALPPGTIVDPRLASCRWSPSYQWTHLDLVANALVARAVQQLHAGEHEAALDHLLAALRLSHHVRSHAASDWLLNAGEMDLETLRGLDLWLEKAPRKAADLRRLLDPLVEHDRAFPSLLENVKASYLRETYLEDYERSRPRETIDSVLQGLFAQTPWERERGRRAQNLLWTSQVWLAKRQPWEWPAREPHATPRAARSGYWDWLTGMNDYRMGEWVTALGLDLPGSPGQSGPGCRWHFLLGGGEPYLTGYELLTLHSGWRRQDELTQLRELELRVAAALYRVERGGEPPDLDALVPAYLPAVPLDPKAGRPFTAVPADF